MKNRKLRPLFVMAALLAAVVIVIEAARLMPGGRAPDEITLATAMMFLVGALAVLTTQDVKDIPRG